MPSKRFVLVAIALQFVLFVLILFAADARRSRRPVSFNGTVEKLGMIAPDVRIPLREVERIEVVGCRLTLAGVHVRTLSGEDIPVDRAPSVEPEIGHPMVFTLENGRNLDAKGKASHVDVEPISKGVEWSFSGDRTVNLFATAIEIENTHLTWEGVTFQRQSPAVVRLSTEQSSSLLLTCRREEREGAPQPSLGLHLRTTQAAGDSTPVSPALVDLDVTISGTADLELNAPRGAVAIGTQTTTLGAGDLKIVGGATVERVRWAPALRPVIDVSVVALSSDVQLGGEQLVPSTLADWSRNPAWTTFAAVVAIALSSLFAKLLDHVWATPT